MITLHLISGNEVDVNPAHIVYVTARKVYTPEKTEDGSYVMTTKGELTVTESQRLLRHLIR